MPIRLRYYRRSVNVLLNKSPTHAATSSITVFRMRNRGPIESAKRNKSEIDIVTDIKTLEKYIESSYNNLKEYITDTCLGNKKEYEIGINGQIIFKGEHSVTNDIINNVNNNYLTSKREVKQ